MKRREGRFAGGEESRGNGAIRPGLPARPLFMACILNEPSTFTNQCDGFSLCASPLGSKFIKPQHWSDSGGTKCSKKRCDVTFK